MKKKVGITLLCSILFVGISHDADAQFWKRLFGGRKKERKSDVRTKATTKTVSPAKKKNEIIIPPTVIKKRYRIDVFAHLYLDELIKDGKPSFKNKIPEKAVGGIDFYEGIKLAADTLNKLGFKIDVFVHDASNAMESPTALIQSKTLDSSDLVIGAVNTQFVPALAGYCKSKRINFISALSPSDAGVKDNPYFTMLQPSLKSHCEWLKAAIEKKYKNFTPVVLYRNSVKVDSNALSYLKLSESNYKKVQIDAFPSKEKMSKLFDSLYVNIVVVPILDVNYVEKLLLQLNTWFPNYGFEIYGMPSWRSMGALKKPEAFPKMGINISIPFYYDITTSIGQAVANSYKKDANSSHPSDMVFRGFETMYWYSHMISKYGTIFNDKITDNSAAPFTRFDVRLKMDKNDNLLYAENKNLSLIRYQGSSYLVER